MGVGTQLFANSKSKLLKVIYLDNDILLRGVTLGFLQTAQLLQKCGSVLPQPPSQTQINLGKYGTSLHTFVHRHVSVVPVCTTRQ